MTNITTEHQ